MGPLGWAGWAHCCPRDASSQFLSQTVSPDAGSDAREQLRSVSFWEEHSSGSRSAGSGSTGALDQLANCLKKVLTPLVWGLWSASFITSGVLIPSDRGGTTLKSFQAHSLLREHMPDYKSTTQHGTIQFCSAGAEKPSQNKHFFFFLLESLVFGFFLMTLTFTHFTIRLRAADIPMGNIPSVHNTSFTEKEISVRKPNPATLNPAPHYDKEGDRAFFDCSFSAKWTQERRWLLRDI